MKKWFSLVLILLLVVALCSACGKPDVVTEDDASEEVEESVEIEEVEEIVEEEPEILGESEEDPLQILSTTWEMAEEYNGVFLQKGEKVYCLGTGFKKTPGVKYWPGNVNYNDVHFYAPCDNSYSWLSFGDIPLPLLEEGDRVIAYSNTTVPTLSLYPVEFMGFSPNIYTVSDVTTYYDMMSGEYTSMAKSDFEKASIIDSDRNEVENYRDLVQNQVYTMIWFEGTKNKEKEVIADSRYISIAGENPIYEIAGEVTMEGFAIYDFSGIPAGIYQIRADAPIKSWGFIEIQ